MVESFHETRLRNQNSEDEAVIRAFTARYALALGLVAVLVTAGFFMSHQLVATQQTAATVVNIAGKQRMLSQRILLMASAAAISPHREAYDRAMTYMAEAVTAFVQNHRDLLDGNPERGLPPETSPAVKALMQPKDGSMGLEARLDAYVKAAQQFMKSPMLAVNPTNPDLLRMFELGPAQMLAQLDERVDIKEREFNADIKLLSRAEFAVWLAVLVVLMLEAFLIFRPGTRQLRRVLQDRMHALTDMAMERAVLEADAARLAGLAEDLEASLHQAVEKEQDLRSQRDELRKLATTDSLTGVSNRRCFKEQLTAALAAPAPVAVLCADLDHFKAVNDTHGHGVGDEVLKAFAVAVAAVIPETAALGRLGGEEFAVLLPDADAMTAVTTAELVRKAVKDIAVVADTGTVKPTVSVGVAWAPAMSEEDPDPDTLLHRGDMALYEAKRRGRDRVVMQEPMLAA